MLWVLAPAVTMLVGISLVIQAGVRKVLRWGRLQVTAESAEGKHDSPLVLCLFSCLLFSLGHKWVTQHQYHIHSKQQVAFLPSSSSTSYPLIHLIFLCLQTIPDVIYLSLHDSFWFLCYLLAISPFYSSHKSPTCATFSHTYCTHVHSTIAYYHPHCQLIVKK